MANIINKMVRGLRMTGHRVVEQIWRLGAGARLFFLTLSYSGESFRRPHLIVREMYFTGVMSLIIILVSAFFVGMVLALTRLQHFAKIWLFRIYRCFSRAGTDYESWGL